MRTRRLAFARDYIKNIEIHTGDNYIYANQLIDPLALQYYSAYLSKRRYSEKKLLIGIDFKLTVPSDKTFYSAAVYWTGQTELRYVSDYHATMFNNITDLNKATERPIIGEYFGDDGGHSIMNFYLTYVEVTGTANLTFTTNLYESV